MLLAQQTARQGNGLEILLTMPDAQTVPVSAELRDVATRWWVPGALVPDVLQRTGFFPRTFSRTVVPEQVAPNVYRIKVERGWYARLCGAQLQPDAGVNAVRVVRSTATGSEHALVQLAPDAARSNVTSTCAVPGGGPATEGEPATCTAIVAGSPGASSTVQLAWPR